jgi:hypothetical protein
VVTAPTAIPAPETKPGFLPMRSSSNRSFLMSRFLRAAVLAVVSKLFSTC